MGWQRAIPKGTAGHAHVLMRDEYLVLTRGRNPSIDTRQGEGVRPKAEWTMEAKMKE
jgi:hypothetical protein